MECHTGTCVTFSYIETVNGKKVNMYEKQCEREDTECEHTCKMFTHTEYCRVSVTLMVYVHEGEG